MKKNSAAAIIASLEHVKPHERILWWPGKVSDQPGWSACQCDARDWQHCHCPVRIVGTPMMVESPTAFRSWP